MNKVKELKDKYKDALTLILRKNKNGDIVEINWVQNKVGSAFRHLWSELLPLLKSEGVKYIVLSDETKNDNDTWGYYGFNGKKNDPKKRFLYIGNEEQYENESLLSIAFDCAAFIETAEELSSFLNGRISKQNLANLIRDKEIISSIDGMWIEI